MPRRSSITSTNDNRNPSVIHSQKPSFSQTVKEGVALGIGSSIGHRIVGFFMGPPRSETIHSQTVIIKSRKQEEYEQCMKDHNDKAVCERIVWN
jgi:hypothetical protein